VGGRALAGGERAALLVQKEGEEKEYSIGAATKRRKSFI
jgi:hypothetical protein